MIRSGAAILAATLTFCAAPALPEPLTEPPTFKRVRPPEPGQGRLITIQIEPVAKPTAALAGRGPIRLSIGQPARRLPGPARNAPPTKTMSWFWASISPEIADIGGGRLAPAEIVVRAHATGAALMPDVGTLRPMLSTYGGDILKATAGTRVSPALVLAVIAVESGGRPAVVSSAGATGLMQLMPATARRFGVKDARDPAQNIAGGVAYLDWLLEEFAGDAVLALAAYNAGEGAVRSHAGVPNFAETRAYVPKVVAAWSTARNLCAVPPERASDGCLFTGLQVAAN